jgi:replicative DNA helicase
MNTYNNGKKLRNVAGSLQQAPIDLSSLVYGKVPPQARDLEQSILGAVMLEREAFFIAVEIIKPPSFYVDIHQRIFSAMVAMASRNQPIDLLTVTEEMRKRNELEIIGGPYFLTRLTNNVVSSAHLDTHCKIIQEKFIQRELIRLSVETLNLSYEDATDAFELLDKTEAGLFAIGAGNSKTQIKPLAELAAPALQKIDALMINKFTVTGIPTGYQVLDTPTGGWQITDLIIIAARPSVGKTAFALNLARNAATYPVKPTPVGFFSLEMSNEQLMQRLISITSQVPLEYINRGRMNVFEYDKVCSAVRELAEVPIYLDDSAGLNIFELRGKARRMVAKYGIGLIIVDYLQLMSGTERKGNREQEISEISRGLKAIAKDLEVPVIALSQLNREPDKRAGGIPVLADLRESGAIEQDADIVAFLYRPDYQQETDQVKMIHRNDACLKIAKHRNGSLETLGFKTDLRIQTWFDEYSWQDYEGKPFTDPAALIMPGTQKNIDLPRPKTDPVQNWFETDVKESDLF